MAERRTWAGAHAGAVGVDRARVGRVRQDAPDRRHAPVVPAARRADAQVVEALHQRHERARLVGIPPEQLGDQRGLGGVGAHAGGIAGPVRVGPVSVRRPGPRQHLPALQLVEPAAPRALGDERALVLGHRPADLQEQLVLGIVGERTVGELDLAAVTLQLLQEQHLMDVVPRQPIRVGDEDAIELGQGGEVAEPVEAGPPQRGPGVAVVAEDVIFRERPLAVSGDASQPVELLVDGLGLGLALGRDSDVDRDSHRPPPGLWVEDGPKWRPSRGAAGRHGPTAGCRRRGRDGCEAPSRIASWGTSRVRTVPGGYAIADGGSADVRPPGRQLGGGDQAELVICD